MVVVLSVSTHTDILADTCNVCRHTIPYLKLAHSLCPSEQVGRKKRQKKEENRKGGLSYSYFIYTLTLLFKKLGGGLPPPTEK